MENLKKQYEYFKVKYKELADKYDGMFAIVHNETVVGICDTFEEALSKAKESGLELGTFLIQECFYNPESMQPLFNSRARFDDSEILQSVSERIESSKPIPSEFSKMIDDEFWNLF